MYRKGGPDTAAADGPRGPILAGDHLQRESLRDCRFDRSATISAQRPQVSQNCECHPKVPSLTTVMHLSMQFPPFWDRVGICH